MTPTCVRRTRTSADDSLRSHPPTGRPWHRSRRAPPAILDSEGEPRYQVERLVGHRGRAPNRHFEVKWKGFGAEENTWEPEQALREDLPELLLSYDRN